MKKIEKDEIFENFQVVSRNYSDASILMHEAIARKAGLSGTDHKYLGLILQHEALTAGDISRLTGLTTGAVTGLIDRLENKALLERQFSKDDRRKIYIVPNKDNCMKLLAPLFDTLQERTSALVATFSRKEMQIIQRYFEEATTIMGQTTNELNNRQ
ncbi:MarR family winged helix-turn-helix transcriptional regulator [Flavobacterium caeni]|uniref:DNA-binding transcriptional regulator, MarR family n=1 Tax=Flavobacterium caeni TaxID=490189 RepID=A0A1G5IP77_9FLAO|nr:MarR family transcriptional regulator [Flavobacterium caeni]SCY77551.1 DNA-binding transcriptional regulator, MarR family [Flavobacterium caeni]